MRICIDAPTTRICPTCNTEFRLSAHQRYKYRLNNNCRSYCSTSCYNKDMAAEKNPKWRGGRIVEKGYVLIYMPEHENAKKGYIAEHRHVLEQHLGRLLTQAEVVHHIDGNPKNNSLGNLMLLPGESAHRKLHQKYRTRDNMGRFSGHRDNVVAII